MKICVSATCVSWCLQNDLTNKDQFGAEPASFWAEIIAHEISIELKKGKEDETAIWIAFDEARSLLGESEGRPHFRFSDPTSNIKGGLWESWKSHICDIGRYQIFYCKFYPKLEIGCVLSSRRSRP